jgi:hypothetical protein
VDGPDPTDLEAEIGRIYQQPLAAFVAARNDLAARLKARGDRAGAERVRSLVKPSVPAWAVNQVFWTARAELDRAMEASRRLRARQHAAGPSAGTELRQALRERREALAAALRKAEESLTRAGHAATPAVMQRVSATLDALSAGPEGTAPLGRLEKEREPPGFEAFTFPPPVTATGSSTLAAAEEAPGSAEAPPAAEGRAFVARAESEVAARQRAVEAATAEAEAARARLEAARTSADEAQRRLGEAEQRAGEAEEALARAAGALARAQQAVREARGGRASVEP